MYKHIKRILDITFATLGLIMLAPLFLVLAAWIKLESKGPVFFKQVRYGKVRKPFVCLKFRTMTTDAPADTATRNLKRAHSYITFSGRILRRVGIDELPQLINILRGEMSLVGPRPVVLAEKDLINERERYGANACLPGIGGWAQSNGRDEIDYKTKARLDGEYAQNFGIKMDFSCLWRTAVAIFTSSGFKEGHIGDTAYKHEVERRTKKAPITHRAYRIIKRGISRAILASEKR